MKELSIKQKAALYDEAIKKVNDYYEGKTKLYSDIDKTLDYLFPTLKEDEDEIVREWIKNELESKYVVDNIVNNVMADKALAWLEKQGEHANFRNIAQVGDRITKSEEGVLFNLSQFERMVKKNENQGEQNHTDKVEPKFKVGDWVIDKQDIVHQIANVTENATYHTYSYSIVGGGYFNDNTEGVRLWTIQDAKDGDVLRYTDTFNRDWIFVYKYKYNKLSASHLINHYMLALSDCFFPGGCMDIDIEYIKPATKKQRDLLFKKMKESGYDWDAEKKELKKIEQNSIEPDGLIEESYQQQADDLIDMVTENPACGEKDEDYKLKRRLMSYLNKDKEDFPERKDSIDDMLSWIEKQSSQHTKNKKVINHICDILVANSVNGYIGGYYTADLVCMLKSLEPLSVWNSDLNTK